MKTSILFVVSIISSLYSQITCKLFSCCFFCFVNSFFFYFLVACIATSNQASQPNSYLTVVNYGVFTSKFSVHYYLAGYEFMIESDGLTQNQRRQYVLPGRAYDIKITIHLMVFLYTWKDIYSNEIMPSQDTCIQLKGTVFQVYVLDC